MKQNTNDLEQVKRMKTGSYVCLIENNELRHGTLRRIEEKYFTEIEGSGELIEIATAGIVYKSTKEQVQEYSELMMQWAANSKTDETVEKSEDLVDSPLIRPDHTRYVISKEIPTESGRPSYDTDDIIAQFLRGKDGEERFVLTVMLLQEMGCEKFNNKRKTIDLTLENLRAAYLHLNKGMQRMNLGNILRGAAKPFIDAGGCLETQIKKVMES